MTTRITTENITDATIGTADLASSVPLNTQWQSVKTASFTAVAGEGYFVDTTSTAITVTLPASPSAGDVVVLKDYARTWDTNAVSIASALFDGATSTTTFSTIGQTITLVYMDGTKGWSLINEDTTTGLGATFISATGGTITTSGDYKIHSFTGDGCFVVSSIGNPAGSDSVDYIVVAGGGGGGNNRGGGGAAGGFREGYNPGSYTASPLATTALPVSASTYPITVGGGGAGSPESNSGFLGGCGSNSVFSTITSAGGGGGGTGKATPSRTGLNGGSGGGGGSGNDVGGPGGSGNTPPVSPPQGNPGGNAVGGSPGPSRKAGGGGGATVAGTNGVACACFSGGGAGATTVITGSPVAYAGGGGGGVCTCEGGPGGTGGGGNGGKDNGPSAAGTANTGGGGGGGGRENTSYADGSAGGKGIVIIRYKFQ